MAEDSNENIIKSPSLNIEMTELKEENNLQNNGHLISPKMEEDEKEENLTNNFKITKTYNKTKRSSKHYLNDGATSPNNNLNGVGKFGMDGGPKSSNHIKRPMNAFMVRGNSDFLNKILVFEKNSGFCEILIFFENFGF